MLYAILKPPTMLLAKLLFRLKSRGREHVPATGPVLFVSNHQSLLDPPLIGAAAPRRLTFLAKAELFRVPLLGGLIRRLGAHPLRREGADAGALRTALRILKDGGSLLVFPEGTRSEDERLGPAKAGAGMLAVLGGAPVIPVYVSGSGRAWPRGRRFPRRALVTVTFGPPLPRAAGGVSRKDDYEAASREMMAAIASLRDSASSGDSRAKVDVAREHRAVGGVGLGGARTSPKYTDGRNRQHEHERTT